MRVKFLTQIGRGGVPGRQLFGGAADVGLTVARGGFCEELLLWKYFSNLWKYFSNPWKYFSNLQKFLRSRLSQIYHI